MRFRAAASASGFILPTSSSAIRVVSQVLFFDSLSLVKETAGSILGCVGGEVGGQLSCPRFVALIGGKSQCTERWTSCTATRPSFSIPTSGRPSGGDPENHETHPKVVSPSSRWTASACHWFHPFIQAQSMVVHRLSDVHCSWSGKRRVAFFSWCRVRQNSLDIGHHFFESVAEDMSRNGLCSGTQFTSDMLPLHSLADMRSSRIARGACRLSWLAGG